MGEVVRARLRPCAESTSQGQKLTIQPRKHYNYSIDPYYSFEIMSHCGWIASLSNQDMQPGHSAKLAYYIVSTRKSVTWKRKKFTYLTLEYLLIFPLHGFRWPRAPCQ